MFGFSSKQLSKEISLPFQVVLELKEDGTFLAKIPHLPGCTARGRTKSDALRNVAETARHHLDYAGKSRFERVWEDPAHSTLNSLVAFFGRLVAGSNRDGCFSSSTGDFGTWVLNPVSKAGSASFKGGNGSAEAEELPEDELDLVDYSPQIYCLSSYAGGGAPRLYAGTSATGSIYESVDGLHWELAYATGEARVHALSVFKDRLYAGTSASGKLFCFTGTHWSLVHRSSETAITALVEFKGSFFMGTYPEGKISESTDGVNWHQAYDTGQTFVRAFCVFGENLYVATSKGSGGIVFRTVDGRRWEKVFESKDPNFYCLTEFHHNLWLGTGNNGRLYRSADGDRWELADTLEDEGVRSMDSFGGHLYLGTEGKGRIYRSVFADTLPPMIEELNVTDITSHSAVVQWHTDRPADSQVRFGEGDQIQASVQQHELTTAHRVALPYLKALSTYGFQVFSRCADGSETAFSQRTQFTTAAAETAELKSTTHPDSEKWYKASKAVLSWNSPEGINRYHYVLDQVPDTVPVPSGNDVVTTGEHSARFNQLEDGSWWFHLVAQDRAGNLGTQAVHFKLNIDTVAPPPGVQSSSHPMDGAWSNKDRVQFNWEAPEDLSGIAGYYLVLDQKKDTVPTPATGVWTEEGSHVAELNLDGEWYLHVISVDNAGNVGIEAGHYHIRLDRRADPPAVESSSHPDPAQWVNSSNLQVQWSPPADASGIAGYYYLLDQHPETVPTAHTGTYTLGSQISFQAKVDGIWYFHVVTADNAGNVGTEASHYALRVDTWAAPPLIDSPTHPQGTWVPQSRVTFELSPAQDLAGNTGFYYILDQERATVPTADKGTFTEDRSIEFKNLGDGLWTLHVISKDAAGNVGVEAAHYAVRVDTEALPPMVSSTSHPAQDDWSRQAAVDMVWDPADDLSGIAQYLYLLDQEPDTIPTAHSGEKTTENRCRINIKEDGTWYFHIVSQDRAGNVGRVAAHYKIKVDTEAHPPRLICPTHPERGAWSNHVKPRFEWFEPDDSSGVVGYYYSIDRNEDTLPTPANGFYTTERYAVIDRGLDSDGTWYFHVVSRDRAGNVGIKAAHYPVHIDTTANPPDIRSSSHPDKHAWSNNGNPIFEWEAPEDDSGIVGYYYLLNHSQATLPTESTGTWIEDRKTSFTGLDDGVWTLHVVSKDRCGNVGTRASHYSIRVDTQALPPAVVSPSHPEGNWVRNATPTFTWTPPKDLSGISGYYYILDRDPSTVPTRESGQFTTGTLANFPKLEDGGWIFHIVSVDQAGNVGTLAGHYSIHVDTTAQAPRALSSTHPKADSWFSKSAPIVSWQTPEDPSGIAGYYHAVDQSPDTIPGLQSTFTTANQVSLAELPDGEWFFHIITKDGAGNLSEEASHVALKIDTSAPVPRVQSTSHPSSEDWFGNTRPTFVWDDGEDLSGIVGHYWSFDHQARSHVQPSTAKYTTGDHVTLPPQKDGVWYFHLASRDQAGNISDAAHMMVKIETVAPKSRLEALPAIVNRPSFEVQWDGSDSVSGVASFDVQTREDSGGEWNDWMSATTQKSEIFKAKDGVTYFFRVRARDHAGNEEAWDEKGPWTSVAIDMTPPEAVKDLTIKAGPAGSVLLTWGAATDATSGVAHYRVYRSTTSGVSGQLVSPDKSVTRCGYRDNGKDLSDGALYYYTIKAVDKAGNECTDGNAQQACVSDQSALPPVLSSSTHAMPLDWYNITTACLHWEEPADSTGIQGYYWILDQSANTIPTEKTGTAIEERELQLDGLKDGTWYVHVVSKDKAGNVSKEAAHYQLNVDTSPPPAPIPQSPSHPNADAWSVDNTVSFNWSVPSDPAQIAGYLWSVDRDAEMLPDPKNANWTTSTSAQVSQLEDGIWYFHVVAKDKAGNLGEKAGHCRIQIARTPPPPRITSPTHPNPHENYTGQTAVFHWATPPFSKPISAFYYVFDQEKDTIPDAKDPKTLEGRAEFQKLADGDWVFHALSVDSSGKLGKMASHFQVHIRSAGSLQGQVTRPNGILPAEGIDIEILKAGKSLGKMITDKEGRFRFHNLPLGVYTAKLSAAGVPTMELDNIELNKSQMTLALSTEVCATPNPSGGAPETRFYVLAREAGELSVQIYTETGKTMQKMLGKAHSAGYLKMIWNTSDVPPGIYLYQAVLRSPEGKFTKYPIRKLQITPH